MYIFLDNKFKVLKVTAYNEQQKYLAALAICVNKTFKNLKVSDDIREYGFHLDANGFVTLFRSRPKKTWSEFCENRRYAFRR